MHSETNVLATKGSAYEAAWARLQHEQPGHAPTRDDQDFEAALVGWLRFHKGMLIGEIIPHVYRYLRDNAAAPERAMFDYILVDGRSSEQSRVRAAGCSNFVAATLRRQSDPRRPDRSYYQEGVLDNASAQERLAVLKLFIDPQDRIALRWLLGYGSNDFRSGAYARLREYCEQNGAEPWDTMVRLSNAEIRIAHTQHLVTGFREIQTELWTLDRSLAEGFTPEVRSAWAKVYGVIAATMQAGATEVADLRAAE
jgi:hypothetical protein